MTSQIIANDINALKKLLGMLRKQIKVIAKAFDTNQNIVFQSGDAFSYTATEPLFVDTRILLYKQDVLGFNGIYIVSSNPSGLNYILTREIKSTDLKNYLVNIDNTIYSILQDKDVSGITFEIVPFDDYEDMVREVKRLAEDKANKSDLPRVLPQIIYGEFKNLPRQQGDTDPSSTGSGRNFNFGTPMSAVAPFVEVVRIELKFDFSTFNLLYRQDFLNKRGSVQLLTNTAGKGLVRRGEGLNVLNSLELPNNTRDTLVLGSGPHKQITSLCLEDLGVFYDKNTSSFNRGINGGTANPNTFDFNELLATEVGTYLVCTSDSTEEIFANGKSLGFLKTGDKVYYDGVGISKQPDYATQMLGNTTPFVVRTFDILVSEFYGNQGNIQNGGMILPIRRTEFNENYITTVLRASTSSGGAFNGAIYYKREKRPIWIVNGGGHGEAQLSGDPVVQDFTWVATPVKQRPSKLMVSFQCEMKSEENYVVQGIKARTLAVVPQFCKESAEDPTLDWIQGFEVHYL